MSFQQISLLIFSTVLTVPSPGLYFGYKAATFTRNESPYPTDYTLTTQSGIVYQINGNTGDLRSVRDTNDNILTFTHRGIESDTGVEVLFERDPQSRVVAVVDPAGNRVGYEYDAQGDLVAVTDREGNVTRFEYSDSRAHFLEEIIDPLGRSGVRSEYDDSGRLKRLLDVNGEAVELIYDPENSIQKVKDELGNSVIYEYDNRGNVIRQINALGHQTFLEYDSRGNTTKITDGNGNIATYTYDSANNLLSRTEIHHPEEQNPVTTYYTYNRYGQNTSLTLPTGATFTTSYDRRGNLLTMKDSNGEIIQSYTYDSRGRTTSESDPFGTSSYSDFDRFGNPRRLEDSTGEILTSTYDKNGRIITLTDGEGTSTFTYDKLGRETFADYGDGVTVKYGYEGAGGDWTVLDAPTIGHIERRFTSDGKLGGWLTPSGGEITFTYDTAGRLKTETTPDGTVTRYEYDKIGRPTKITDSGTGLVTLNHYDTIIGVDPDPEIGDNLIGRLAGRTIILDEKTRYTTTYTYYADGRTKTVTDNQGNTWFYRYTLTSTIVVDPLGRETTTLQTENYLPQETRYADGTTSKSEYLFGNNLLEGTDYPTLITQPGGHDRKFTYDNLGQLATATDLGNNTFSYSYRPQGDDTTALKNFIAKYDFATTDTGIDFFVENQDGDTLLAYDYNDEGDLKRVIYEDGGERSFTYDNKNRLQTVTQPDGIKIQYTYNNIGQEDLRQYYDSQGNLIKTVATEWTTDGQIASITDNAGTITYHYNDQNGALSQEDTPTGGNLRYQYDALGRITEVAVKPSEDGVAAVTQYEYDGNRNIVKITDPLGGETVMTYDGVNRLTTRTLPNGVTSTYTYQKNTDWISSITHRNRDGAILAQVTYERNQDGTPHTITRENGSYVKLKYDNSLRLTQETYYSAGGIIVDDITYTYDRDGNRHTVNRGVASVTYHYNNVHQLNKITTATGNESYLYDSSGRVGKIIRDGETLTLKYNENDQLERITDGNGAIIARYTYDAQGHRIKVDERKYIVAPMVGTDLESPYLVTNGSGEVVSRYVYAGDTPLLRLDENGNPVYYLTDALGSVIGLADGSGGSAARFHYDSFGNLRGATGTKTAVSEAAGGDFRFQGQWLEANTDLYHFRARYYDPETGRFVSRDPVDIVEREPESSNLYQFAYHNPRVYADPSGAITLNELQIRNTVQNILSTIRQNIISGIRDEVKDRALGVAGDILNNFISKMLPVNFNVHNDTINKYKKDPKKDPGTILEELVRDTVCDLLRGAGVPTDAFNSVWIEPHITNDGVPKTNGVNCNREYQSPGVRKPEGAKKPDFLISGHPPLETNNGKKSWLIGDFKLNPKDALNDVRRNKGQWQAMKNYARTRQYIGFTLYINFDQPDTRTDGYINKAKGEAIEDGILLNFISLTTIVRQ